MNTEIKKATIDDRQTVSALIASLLLELAADAQKEIEVAGLDAVASHTDHQQLSWIISMASPRAVLIY